MANQDVWLVIPVYHEAAVIGSVVRHARETFSNIVCVDDGSRDNSAAEALAAGAVVIRHPINLGQGAALQTGIEFARSQPGAAFLVTFDADGQHDVADALRMVQRLRSSNLDIVLGTRFHGNVSHIPVLKRLVLQTAVRLSARSRRLKLTDAHNGLRAFTRETAEKLDIRVNGMGHAEEFIQLVDELSLRVAEEPVTIAYTDYSMSKGQSLLNGVNILFDRAAHRR